MSINTAQLGAYLVTFKGGGQCVCVPGNHFVKESIAEVANMVSGAMKIEFIGRLIVSKDLDEKFTERKCGCDD